MIPIDEGFKVTPNEIFAKQPCRITLNDQDYEESSFIETSDKIILPGILDFFFEEENDYCRIVINYLVDLNKNGRLDRDGHLFTIYYDKGDLVISKDYRSTDFDMAMLRKLLQGSIKFIRDPKVLLNIILDNLDNVDISQIELLISNMFRVNGNESELCRYKGDYSDSVILGASKQPFVDSWKSALAFQHIEKAIQNGLIEGNPLKNNPIESVMNEDFDKL